MSEFLPCLDSTLQILVLERSKAVKSKRVVKEPVLTFSSRQLLVFERLGLRRPDSGKYPRSFEMEERFPYEVRQHVRGKAREHTEK